MASRNVNNIQQVMLVTLTIEFNLYIVVPCHPWHHDIPFVLNIVVPCHPWHHDIPFILNIVVPCHPWHHDIPFILNIKKAMYCYIAFSICRTKLSSVYYKRLDKIVLNVSLGRIAFSAKVVSAK